MSDCHTSRISITAALTTLFLPSSTPSVLSDGLYREVKRRPINSNSFFLLVEVVAKDQRAHTVVSKTRVRISAVRPTCSLTPESILTQDLLQSGMQICAEMPGHLPF